MASNIGLSKVFILDKYFKELQKFWQTEKMLQGMWINIINIFFFFFFLLLLCLKGIEMK